MYITSPPPSLMDILVKYVFELGEYLVTTGGKKIYQHTGTLRVQVSLIYYYMHNLHNTYKC